MTVLVTPLSKILNALVFLIFLVSAAGAEETQPESAVPKLSPTQLAVQAELKTLEAKAKSRPLKTRASEINAHYKANDYPLFWTRNGEITDRAKAIMDAIERAPEHALDPEDYNLLPLLQAFDTQSPDSLAEFDIGFSNALVAFAQHLNAGRLNPNTVSRENVIYPKALAADKILQQASSTGNIALYLRLLAPRTPRYDRLRRALAKYKRLAKNGGWEMLPEGEVLKPGMVDDRVPALRKRLSVSGDYVGSTANQSTVYEGDIVDAVMTFQQRHGLEIDGVIGGNTLAQLNVSIEDRIAIMEYNLERRRWMQDDYGQYYIFANLADQVLKVVRNEKTIHAELIQVGLPYHRTPVFTDELEYIEINPYWNVPRSIAVNELLPKLKANAGALGSQNFEVLSGGSVVSAYAVPWSSYSKGNFPVRLRQKPGTGNALGRIKFMFPNKFNVYIHDTPSKSKFSKASRFFSHGCLRLKDPLTMAEVLLADKGWSRAKIDGVVASRKRTVVKLDQKIPVHIAYMTAWVNKDGSIHFRRDVYGRDKVLEKALNKARS